MPRRPSSADRAGPQQPWLLPPDAGTPPGPGIGTKPPADRESSPRCHPFLKWAGGKRQLLPVLWDQIQRIGTFRTYHEPFLGGGALFFDLWNRGRIREGASLSDVNPHLMDAWRGVQADVESVIHHLRVHQQQHSPEHYYATRVADPEDLAERAARIIYLNRTCFNGLYRENRSGRFNVPMGRYRNPTICDEPTLRAASVALAAATIRTESFEGVAGRAAPGDLVYFDPPYVPLSRTASFTDYAADGFSLADQRRLAEVFGELADRGVHVMLSNAGHDLVRDLYRRFYIHRVLATRSVNSRADRRGPVEEVLVTSF